eukprot:766409-Hanusia_phi.AAC.6
MRITAGTDEEEGMDGGSCSRTLGDGQRGGSRRGANIGEDCGSPREQKKGGAWIRWLVEADADSCVLFISVTSEAPA